MFLCSDAHKVALLSLWSSCPWEGSMYLSIADRELLQEVAQHCGGVFDQAVPQDLLSNCTYCHRAKKLGQNCLLEKPWAGILKKTFLVFPPLSYFILKHPRAHLMHEDSGNQCSDPSINNHKSNIWTSPNYWWYHRKHFTTVEEGWRNNCLDL